MLGILFLVACAIFGALIGRIVGVLTVKTYKYLRYGKIRTIRMSSSKSIVSTH